MQLSFGHLDILRAAVNSGVGRAAVELNEMVSTHITLCAPSLNVLTPEDIQREVQHFGKEALSAVRLGFADAFEGSASLVFPPDSAAKLVALLTGEEPGTPDLDALRAGTLSEVGNIVINGVMGAVGNLLRQPLRLFLPLYIEDTFTHLLVLDDPTTVPAILLAKSTFSTEALKIEGNVILLFEMRSFGSLLNALDVLQ